jgi:hypothetical protein
MTCTGCDSQCQAGVLAQEGQDMRAKQVSAKISCQSLWNFWSSFYMTTPVLYNLPHAWVNDVLKHAPFENRIVVILL